MVILLEMTSNGTNVAIESSDIPSGIHAADEAVVRSRNWRLFSSDDKRDLAPKLAADATVPRR